MTERLLKHFIADLLREHAEEAATRIAELVEEEIRAATQDALGDLREQLEKEQS
jgi:hypothetical protein